MTSYNLTIIVTYSEGVLSTSKFLKTAPGPPFIDLEKVTDANIEIHWLFNKWPVEGTDLNLKNVPEKFLAALDFFFNQIHSSF